MYWSDPCLNGVAGVGIDGARRPGEDRHHGKVVASRDTISASIRPPYSHASRAGNMEIARTTGADRFGVGMNVLCIGQSNMSGYGGPVSTAAGDFAGLFSNDHQWKHLQ